MNENESINFNNYNNNQTYIKTNKDDINSLENLKSTMQTGFNDNNNNNIENDNNNYFNSNSYFNLFSPFGMAGMYMMGGQNTFFDKLFMTLERANYQLYHLCEMIKLVQRQKPTLKFFKSIIISAFKAIKEKYFAIITTIKEYLKNLKKNIFSFNNDKYDEEELKNHIKIIDYAINFLLGCLVLIIAFQIF